MDIFSRKTSFGNFGPGKNFPSPQTRRQVSATGFCVLFHAPLSLFLLSILFSKKIHCSIMCDWLKVARWYCVSVLDATLVPRLFGFMTDSTLMVGPLESALFVLDITLVPRLLLLFICSSRFTSLSFFSALTEWHCPSKNSSCIALYRPIKRRYPT